jgi:hypothetical protein
MPNIIEQQDLLKGLPDNRLAMMMQNPTGDIPPFLVAAEAQRRQAIREQFSGGPQESVVDTLTKQLANVPQNVQAQPQTPPQMPPPMMQPEMAGVAALQQQMPQQAPQQAMRRGGYVQRYQAAGLVSPLPTRVQDIATQFGVTVDQAAEMLQNNPSLGGGSPQPGLPFRITEENRETFASPIELNLPAITVSPDELSDIQREERREAKYQEMDSAPGYGAAVYANRSAIVTSPSSSMGMSFVGGVPTANPSTPPNPDAGKDPTSGENKLKGMSIQQVEAEYRKIFGTSSEDTEYMRQKLKELYDYEPSSWEKAQKWFSAAQAAIEPGQNNWQATINALAALGGGMAEERSGQRASERELAEAMLKLEMADRAERRQSEQNIAKGVFDWRVSQEERERASNQAARDEQLEYLKWRSGEGMQEAGRYDRQIQNLREAISDRLKSLQMMMTPEEAAKDPTIVDLTNMLRTAEENQRAAMGESLYGRRQYGEAINVPFDYETADGVNPIIPPR